MRDRPETIQILLERLNWPVRMVRWQAARQMAALLQSKCSDVATDLLLQWIKTRKLENEVVSGLAVLLCASPDRLPPFQKLKRSIMKPSILADFIVCHLYGKELGGWHGAHSQEAPAFYQPDDYFEKYKRSHVPPILSTQLRSLERRSGYAFSSQWAFEWRELMDATQRPYSGFPHHFIDSAVRGSGYAGQFSQQQDNVYRSAFLRTLSFAVENWDMPPEFASSVSLACLPVNKGFLKITPMRRPKWLSDIPEKCCKQNAPIEKLVRRLIKPDIATRGMRPVSFRIPLSSAVVEFGEVIVSACLVTSDFRPKPAQDDDAHNMMLFTLRDGLTFGGPLDEREPTKYKFSGLSGLGIPVCLDIFPSDPGFWHNDYFHGGVALLAPFNSTSRLDMKCQSNGIELRSGKRLSSRWRVWHDNWSPIHPADAHTKCGMLTEVGVSDLELAKKLHGLELAWLVQVKIWQRPKEYGELALNEQQTFFRD